jgi:hypothetical protein
MHHGASCSAFAQDIDITKIMSETMVHAVFIEIILKTVADFEFVISFTIP